MKIKNPVIPGFYPDPSVCHANGKYYLVNSSFEFYPGIPIWQSDDLVNWQQIGHCLTTPAQAKLQSIAPSRGVWAPSIRWHNGTFYVCTTNMDGGGNFFITAQNPAGPWSEPIFVSMKSIDPSLFFEDDNIYFMTPQTKTEGAIRGIYMAQIDPRTGQLLTKERLLWQGSGGKCLEAPHLYHIGDYYYLIAAEGGTEYGHGITVARSKHLWGPYTNCPHNPIVTNRDDHDNPLQCAGHGDLIEAPDGNWAMVLLASRWGSKWHSHIGRETCLVPILWKNAWPTLADGGHNLTEKQEIPWLQAPQNIPTGFSIDFSKPLPHSLAYLRVPDNSCYTQDTSQASLTLRGKGSLSTSLTPTFIGHRQQAMCCTCNTTVEFSPTSHSEAGLTVYLAPHYHFDIAITKINNTNMVILRQTVGEYLSCVTAQIPLPGGPLQLTIQAEPTLYHFKITTRQGKTISLGSAETKLLSNETAKLFTGTFFALYCCDAAEKAKAKFSQFNCVYSD